MASQFNWHITNYIILEKKNIFEAIYFMVCIEEFPKTHPKRIPQQSTAYFLLYQIPVLSLLLKVIQ
jgi:hypothetical protein